MSSSKPKPAPEPIDIPQIDLLRWWHDLVHWLTLHWLQIAIAVGAGFIIYGLLSALRSFGKRQKLKLAGGQGYATGLILAKVAAKTSHFFMVMTSARLVAGYANPPELMMRTIAFLFTVSAVFQSAIWAREIVLGLIERKTLEEGSQGETLSNAMGIIRLLVTTALFSIAVIVVLDNLGVNVTGLVAGLGVGGIAIGLAAQGIFSDLFAALSIIFDKPFRRGETIRYDQTSATVQRIGLKTTRLQAVTGEKVIISNANLLQKEITNLAHLDHRRVKFAIGVIYQTDPDKAAQIPDILREIIEGCEGKFVRSGFVNFGQSSLDFEVEFDVYAPDWDEVYKVRHRVGLAILKRFNKEKLEFAYPTQTTFTAAPDGRMIMPYPMHDNVKPAG